MAAAAPALKRLVLDVECGKRTVELANAVGVPIPTTAPGLGAKVGSLACKFWSWCFCGSPWWVAWLVGVTTLVVIGEVVLMFVR